MTIRVNTYPYEKTATPLSFTDHENTLTIHENFFDGDNWVGSGTVNWGWAEIITTFTISHNRCTLHFNGEGFEGSEPLELYLYTDRNVETFTENEIYSIVHATQF